MKLRLVALLVLVAGAAMLVGAAVRARHPKAQKLTDPRPFVIQYVRYKPDKTGSLEPNGLVVRAVSETGQWKETAHLPSGKTSTWGASDKGIFTQGPDSQQYYGEFNPDVATKAMRSEEGLKHSPQLAGTEDVAGLHGYILRAGPFDVTYAPETGATELKEVIRDTNTNAVIELLEAVSVEFRPLTDDEIKLPDLPVKTDLIMHRIEVLKDSHHDDRAAQLSEALDRFRATNPGLN